MPKMDGPTATAQIKAECDPAPIVLMLTAKGTQADVIQGLVGAPTTTSSSRSPRAS